MIKKLFPHINDELAKYVNGDDYTNLIISKFKVPDYEKWKSKINGVKLGDTVLLSDSTDQNVCYTAFKTSSKTIGELKVIDFFYIQKSRIADFFIIYVKSRVVANYPDEKIIYPSTLIVSPETIYAPFFREARTLIIENYPNAQMIPFYMLSRDVSLTIPHFKGEKINYYRALFGYEGDILNSHITGDPNFWF